MTVTETSTPTDVMTGWLDAFGAALEAGDIDAAVELFGTESYWRDLVSFTWNIKTVEGRDGVRDMLEHTLADVAPSNFTIVGDANEADGVVDGWFDFETGVGRGHGQLRLIDGKCFTILTTLVELKGSRNRPARSVPGVSSTASSPGASPGWNFDRTRRRGSATRCSPTW